MSDTWCALPWIHMCVRPNNSLKPCCRFQVDDTRNLKVNLESIEEHGIDAMNDSYWTQLRKDMLDGTRRSECQKCYKQEETSELTDRTSMRLFLKIDSLQLLLKTIAKNSLIVYDTSKCQLITFVIYNVKCVPVCLVVNYSLEISF